jgi:Cys-tRNA(Pro)/Cys-tRNA(Cys) deacylase
VTPAVRAARAAGIAHSVHEYAAAGGRGYGAEAAAALGIPPARVFKTLVARLDGAGLAVAIVPVAAQLDLKRLAAAAGAKRAEMAPPREAERATGYVRGGISPLGQRRRLPTFLDASALGFETVFVSGGRRGLELELPPQALCDACGARTVRIAR